MNAKPSKIFFDDRDYRLLNIVNDVFTRNREHSDFKELLTPYLHPHGIKELASSKELRVAYSVIHLLGSLETGMAEERLHALRSLKDEVLTTARGTHRNNRARILIQIMKELVRSRDDQNKQLRLAHDFRTAILGSSRIVHQQLQKYHLIEMPEEWNQVSFDDRVHDANSKGRKSATHLIMDAWIKGIRRLTVVYYNCVDPNVAAELLESASIMDITVHVGLELYSRHRGKYIRMIFEPRGFTDKQDYLYFLKSEPMQRFMAEGRKVQVYQQGYVVNALESFVKNHKQSFEKELGTDLPDLDEQEFMLSVGSGQPTLQHLGKYIHEKSLPLLRERVEELQVMHLKSNEETRERIEIQIESLNSLDPDTIIERYLKPDANPDLPNPFVPSDDPDVPSLLTLTPAALSRKIKKLHPVGRITLGTSDLTIDDVIELLYDCGGDITHLELYSIKTHPGKGLEQRLALNELQMALNSNSAIAVKRIIRARAEQLRCGQDSGCQERFNKLSHILWDIDSFLDFYRGQTLKSRIGSGSTGQSTRTQGMGFVVRETLPIKGRKDLNRRQGSTGQAIPATAELSLQVTYSRIPGRRHFGHTLCSVPFLRDIFCFKRADWKTRSFCINSEGQGNVYPLGGIQESSENRFSLKPRKTTTSNHSFSARYLNRNVLNALKVLVGFIPAFATFALTKDWWVLAYLGAFIWFGITGVRNIIQSILGGGGLGRSSLLRWNDYLSWDRICTSLMFTGFSVPLLDWLLKTKILNNGFDINTTTSPLLLYSIMALTNGIYIFSHNIFRGLPKSAAFLNLFRSVLSIPIALAFNSVVGLLLSYGGVLAVDMILQKWAAVISKLASDCVAGAIEGLADKGQNILMRRWDYKGKLRQMFQVFTNLELLFPEKDMLKTMAEPDSFINLVRESETGLEKIVMTNALDFLYFWMYQPRAASALKQALAAMTAEEREIFLVSQQILNQERDISRLFVDGVVGKRFSKALSFYLMRYPKYLKQIQAINLKHSSMPNTLERCPEIVEETL